MRNRYIQAHVPAENVCTHAKVTPQVSDQELAECPLLEVQRRYPRFVGTCPDCGAELIAYASYRHYLAGGWYLT